MDFPAEVLVATQNHGKLEEYQRLFAQTSMRMLTLSDISLPSTDMPDENGASFAANARIKAVSLAKRSGHLTLADDGGVVVPALGGAPGIYTARWAGEPRRMATAITRVLSQVETPTAAAYACVMCLAKPDGSNTLADGEIWGTLVGAHHETYSEAMNFDPVFKRERDEDVLSTFSAEQRYRDNHRARAWRNLFARTDMDFWGSNSI